MFLCAILVVQLFIAIATSENFTESASKFRILAPQFVCPKDGEALVEKSDNTVITLQTAEENLEIVWTVRWLPLVRPTQQFTLILWKTVRAMEKLLNKSQPEPYVYVIENSELLKGVNYIFNVSAVGKNGHMELPKTFNIDNTQGDQKLMIEGRNDMLSIILVGSQVTFTDKKFTIEAQVTTCFPTEDFYFSWTVMSVSSGEILNISQIIGSQLYLLPYTLKVGELYNIICKVYRDSNGDLITQTSLPFKVSYRGLKVYLNVDYVIISADHPFSIESIVLNHDYYETPVTYKWECLYQNEACNFLETFENDTLIFPNGFPDLGEYKISLTVTVLDQTSFANATLFNVAPILPILQINPVDRLINEGMEVSLVANASNVAPSCSMSWYFASEESLALINPSVTNGTCADCEHGELLSETLTILSLEEQFLSELADFTNETEWRQVTTSLPAKAGRARFVARCGCSLTFSCETKGTVYAELWFRVNEGPKPAVVMITPDTGTAMETILRISTLAATDLQTPLQYSFYCRIDENEHLLLASYVDHRAVETFLPFVAGGTEVWVEVCDSLGACSTGASRTVSLSSGEGRTVDLLIDEAAAYSRRCELDLLKRIAVSALVTYTTYEESGPLTKFTEAMHSSMLLIDSSCIETQNSKFLKLLSSLERIGIDISNYIQ